MHIMLDDEMAATLYSLAFTTDSVQVQQIAAELI